MSHRSAALYRLVASAIAAGSIACGSDKVSAPPTVASVVVTPGTDTLATLGRTRQFTAVAKDANGNPVSVTLVWRSTNPAVAMVDSATGIVTAVANGSTIIRVDAGGVIGQAPLLVVQAVAGVVVSPPSAGFTSVGDTQRLAAVAKDSGGAIVPGVRFVWGSSDQSVATVDTGGLLRSKGPGKTFITAAGRGVPGYGVVTVTQSAYFLFFNVLPTFTVAGDPITPAVQVEVWDSLGHRVAGSRDAITLDVYDYQGAGGGVALHGTRTVNAVDGVATFSGLWLTAAGKYVLSATDTALGNVSITDTFVVAPAAAHHLTFESQPTSILGDNVLPTLSVAVRDQFENRVTGFVGDNIVLDFSVNPWGGVSAAGDSATGASLGGVTLLPPDSGRALFAGITVDKPAVGYRLRARLPATPGVAAAVSNPFNVSLQFGTVLAAGASHTCAVSSTGTYCWGSNALSQLAGTTGPSSSDSVPQPASGGLSLVAISSQDYQTCGLNTSGAAYCWGPTPALVPGGHTFVAISSGQSHTCGLTGTGSIYCWGANSSGELGNGTTGSSSSTPVLVSGGLTFQAVAAGASFTCGLTTVGAAYCWGADNQGQLGNGAAGPDSVPHAVSGGLTFTRLTAGLFHACAVAADSTAYCWGGNSIFQDGDGTGTTTAHQSPNAVFGGYKYLSLTAGELHTCGILPGGFTRCWGANEAGQLGAGFANAGNSSPVFVTGGQSFTALAVGGHHTCGYTGTALYCWGSDASGQLGDGRSTDQSHPVRVVQ